MTKLFDHDGLEVYQAAREFNRELRTLLDRLPRGYSASRDQLRRSGTSITRNIAEGSGKWAIKDKVHYYHIARGSATESAAELDSLVDYGALSEEEIERAKRLLSRVVAMLVRMIRSLESREGPTMDSATPKAG